MEAELGRVRGVVGADVNLTAEQATVRYTPGVADMPSLEAAVERAGFKALPPPRPSTC